MHPNGLHDIIHIIIGLYITYSYYIGLKPLFKVNALIKCLTVILERIILIIYLYHPQNSTASIVYTIAIAHVGILSTIYTNSPCYCINA